MQMRTLLLTSFVATVFSALVVVATVDTRLLGDNSGYKPVQPIAYSHRLHAGELKIDCQFCHTGAEKGRHAAIPPVSTCMKCHDQVKNKPGSKEPSPEIAKLHQAIAEGKNIEWTRIHRMPAFVFFNHSRHINSQVACQSCHGEIQTMETVEQTKAMTMGECLACHRETNQKSLAAGKKATAPTDCSACHY
jgi:hypothetical protein